MVRHSNPAILLHWTIQLGDAKYSIIHTAVEKAQVDTSHTHLELLSIHPYRSLMFLFCFNLEVFYCFFFQLQITWNYPTFCARYFWKQIKHKKSRFVSALRVWGSQLYGDFVMQIKPLIAMYFFSPFLLIHTILEMPYRFNDLVCSIDSATTVWTDRVKQNDKQTTNYRWKKVTKFIRKNGKSESK